MFPPIKQTLASSGGHMLGSAEADAVTEARSASWVKEAEAKLAKVQKDYSKWLDEIVQTDVWKSKTSRRNVIKRGRGHFHERMRERYIDPVLRENEQWKQKAAEAELRVRKQQSEALNRITNHFIYKGYTIKPMADDSVKKIRYLVTKPGTKDQGPYDTIDQAKAKVDERVATVQQAEVDSWTIERVKDTFGIKGDAEARTFAVENKHVVDRMKKQEGAPSGGKPFKLDGKILAIGGAAALAALVVLK